MKVFWVIIAGLAAVTAALFLLPKGSPTAVVTETADERIERPVATAVADVESATDGEPADIRSDAFETANAEAAIGDQEESEPTGAAVVDEAVVVEETATLEGAGVGRLAGIEDEPEAEGVANAEASDERDESEAKPVATLAPDAMKWLQDSFGAADGAEDTIATPDGADAPTTSTEMAETDRDDAEPETPTVAIDHVEERDDGSLLVGGRWVVTGSGSAEDPYVMDWRVLQSAGRIYKPRLGRDKLPEWAERFDGKRVKLTGYAMLPIGQGAAKDILVMLNQWDGCCIGVPPTPYDAAEVMLDKPLTPTAAAFGHQGANAYGDVEGTLKIDPYIVNSLLLGLYVIEDASFDRLAG